MLALPTVRALVLWDSEEALRHQIGKGEVLRLDVHVPIMVSLHVRSLIGSENRSVGLCNSTITEPSLLGKPRQPASAAQLPPCVSSRRHTEVQRSGRGRDAWPPSARGSSERAMARKTWPAVLVIPSSPQPRWLRSAT